MSRTGTRPRIPQDAYGTPWEAFEPLIPYLPKAPIWEPACGDGRLVRWIRESGRVAFGSDTHPTNPDPANPAPISGIETGDFLKYRKAPGHAFAIVTNPPYKLAFPFVRQALHLASETFMLLRLGFLASAERKAFFQQNPVTALFVLSKRPAFVCAAKCRKCGLKWSQRLEAVRPRLHRECGGSIAYVTTDMADYAWFYWGARLAHVGITHL